MAMEKGLQAFDPQGLAMHKCERCSSPATVHITEVLGEAKFEEHHVCESCYPKYLQDSQKGGNALTAESGAELEEALFGQQECPDCGIKFVDFRNSHRLGCSRDYQVFHNFDEVLHHSQQVGGDVVITLDANNTITLQRTSIASLHAQDFLFE